MRKTRMALAGAVVIAVVTTTAGCGGGSATSGGAGSGPAGDTGTPHAGGALTVVIPDAIDGWNPDTAVELSTYQLIREVEAPLLGLSDDAQQVAPGLAASWHYDKTRTKLTLTLNPNAAFSTGKPVTPADVVFSVNQWKAGATYGSFYSTVIKSVRASGPNSVTLTLAAPSSALVPILTWSNSAIIPANFGGRSKASFYKRPIGAGPFQIASQVGHETIMLTRNPHFYQAGQPYLDSIAYHVVATTSQRLLQVQSGQAGMADRIPLDSLSSVSSSDHTSMTPSSSVSLITFAEKAAPMSNPQFRRAVSLAIDRAALVKSVYDGHAKTATGLLPSIVPGDQGCPTCRWATTSTTQAKAALADSGYSGTPVQLLVDSSRGIDLLAAQAIQPMLEAAGIKVQIQQVDSAAYLTRVSGGNFQMAIGNYNALAPTPVDPLSFVAATGYLFSGASTTPALTAMGAVSAAPTVAKQASAVAAFEKANYHSATLVPLLSPDVASAFGARLHGLTLLPSGLYDAAALWLSS